MKKGTRKIIPALDIDHLERVGELVKTVDNHDLIYGYKVGFIAGLTHGLPQVVECIRRYSRKPIIYDHQKAATDIPDMGEKFALLMKKSGVDEVILFPQAGPATLEAWVRAVQQVGLTVIVGGIMTHPQYRISEGGYLDDDAIKDIYIRSASLGVERFVVPLTKPKAVKEIFASMHKPEQAVFYSPGFGKQGGDAQAFSFLSHHLLIVGRSLIEASDPLQYLNKVSVLLKDLQEQSHE